MTNFNYYLEIAAIFIYIVIIALYYQQNFIVNKAHYAFLWLWLFGILIPIFNIASIIGIELRNVVLYEVTNTIYYLAQQCLAYTFMIYTLAPLWRREKVPVWKMILFSIPYWSCLIVIATNFKTHFLYYLDTQSFVYYHGSYSVFPYATAFFYFGYSIYYASTRRDVYNRSARNAMYSCLVIVALSTIASFVWPEILNRGFTVSLALLNILVVTMNSHARQDKETGILNRDAFYEWVKNLFYNKVDFNVIAVRAADYEVMVSTYGIDVVKKMQKEIILDIKDIIPRNRGYALSDDIFAILYENQDDIQRKKMEKRINEAMMKKRTIDGMDMSFSHFLVTFKYPEKFKNIEELRSLIVYFEKMHRMRYGIMSTDELAIRNLQREKEVEQAVMAALSEHKFEIFYQPIINVEKNSFTCSEALIRLMDSPIGPIGPDEFIPIAEHTGLIIQIGDFVIDEVFKFISEHDLKALGVEYIELNLSTIQCLQRDFIKKIEDARDRYDISPESVCFEITETASNCAPDVFLENLKDIHELGYKLAIDDFGTGYGNLHRLLSVDFDIVKFDKNTTAQICEDDKVRPIFSRMVYMIHTLKNAVVNEGVETREQFEFLKTIKTDYIQGYFFSKPVSGDEYINFLKEKN